MFLIKNKIIAPEVNLVPSSKHFCASEKPQPTTFWLPEKERKIIESFPIDDHITNDVWYAFVC